MEDESLDMDTEALCEFVSPTISSTLNDLMRYACSSDLAVDKLTVFRVNIHHYIIHCRRQQVATMYWRFTPASMVWSFGMIMYEIWSLGQEPYKLMENVQVIESIQAGYRLSPPAGCFRSIYEIMVACWHPDPSMRPQPSTILKYLLQLDCLAEMNDVPRSEMFEIGADVSAGAGLHSDLQDTYLLYVNSKANKNDTGPYVNVDRRGSNISKEVIINGRWSVSEEEDESSLRGSSDYDHLEDISDYENGHLYMSNENEQSTIVAASPVGEMDNPRLTSLRKALATNFHGRWSLSTRGSEHSFDESEDHNWMTPRREPRRRKVEHLMSLPPGGRWSADSMEETGVNEVRPRQIECDDIQTSPITMRPVLQDSMVAAHLSTRWSDYDHDDDADNDSDCEKFQTESPLRGSIDRLSNNCHQYKLESEKLSDISSSTDSTQSDAKVNGSDNFQNRMGLGNPGSRSCSADLCLHDTKVNGIDDSQPKLVTLSGNLSSNMNSIHYYQPNFEFEIHRNHLSKTSRFINGRPKLDLTLRTVSDCSHPTEANSNKSSTNNKSDLGRPSDSNVINLDQVSECNTPSPKTSRPKPPIKPRKKLPKLPTNQPQSLSPQQGEQTLTTSSSAPSIHVPKAAPRKTLLRAVSAHSYDHVQPYQSIDNIDQEYLDEILQTAQNGTVVPVHYYNVPAAFHCSTVANDMDENSYEQVQGYERIQTYETVPYQLELGFENT